MPSSGPALTRANPITNLLGAVLKTNPDELTLVSAATSISWRQLDETSTRLAKQYLALGLEPGDRVASLMPRRSFISRPAVRASPKG